MLKIPPSNFSLRLLGSLGLLGFSIILLASLIFPSTVKAVSSDELEKKSRNFCGSGSVPSTDSACRNGFRWGYDTRQSIEESCKNRPGYSAEMETSCENGYIQGQRLKAEENQFTGKCGEGDAAVKTKFNFGCRGKGNPIVDILFAIIRFLTYGVGIIVVISIILAGIKYSTSEGNPEATMAAKTQIQNAVIALMAYLFIFAILNFLVPGGLIS